MAKKIKVTLSGSGGELDSRTVDNAEQISAAVKELADECELAVGDSITIEEAES
jgi:hypothetical protein